MLKLSFPLEGSRATAPAPPLRSAPSPPDFAGLFQEPPGEKASPLLCSLVGGREERQPEVGGTTDQQNRCQRPAGRQSPERDSEVVSTRASQGRGRVHVQTDAASTHHWGGLARAHASRPSPKHTGPVSSWVPARLVSAPSLTVPLQRRKQQRPLSFFR